MPSECAWVIFEIRLISKAQNIYSGAHNGLLNTDGNIESILDAICIEASICKAVCAHFTNKSLQHCPGATFTNQAQPPLRLGHGKVLSAPDGPHVGPMNLALWGRMQLLTHGSFMA